MKIEAEVNIRNTNIPGKGDGQCQALKQQSALCHQGAEETSVTGGRRFEGGGGGQVDMKQGPDIGLCKPT